jgi:Glutamate-cysteine ligase family 2(GCS2)
MGRDISKTRFTEDDLVRFKQKLMEEYRILADWFQSDRLKSQRHLCGFELEAWLVDRDLLPAPKNEAFLSRIAHPLVVPELSQFNFEINSTPQHIEGPIFSNMENELQEVWQLCADNAAAVGSDILATGILPTIRDDMLTLDHMTRISRYFALNDQVFRMREGQAIELNIQGRDILNVTHQDVMLEAVTTSLQIHLQVSAEDSVRFYNTSQILSAPMVAVAANSPYLFGKDLWDETRIPVFEQAVYMDCYRDSQDEPLHRVTFGSGYAKETILEPFLENLELYPVLIPQVFDEPPELMSHLRLHNGTIWRWTRPLIGMDHDGTPHIRIEHRAPAAGPSLKDVIANIAFFVGLMSTFTRQEIPLEEQISFDRAEENFYQAARNGLSAQIRWTDGKNWDMQNLLEEVLIPAARRGLKKCGIVEEDISCYIDDIIQNRVRTGQNGTCWQRAFIAAHGPDFQKMTRAYFENQKRNIPVHEWDV